MKKAHLISFFLTLFFIYNYSVLSEPENRVYGITIDAVNNLNSVVTSLTNLCVRPTTRIVFDEWQPASNYSNAVNRISPVSNIMGEILDSYYMNQYSVQQYKDRVDEYLAVMGDKVNIWEVGNEVNGEWLGNSDSTMAKIYYAFYRLKKAGKVTAITLYYNKNCWENPQNEMFRWTNRIPLKIKDNMDYVFVSYYEDDCNNLQPNWQSVFDSLHVLFPNSKLGIGECGTTYASRKIEYINRYYTMRITTPNYVGGYFWWYYKQDCVPFTKPLWAVLNTAIGLSGQFTVNSEFNNDHQLPVNYPNPFNPVTTIFYNIKTAGNTRITVYDILGREVKSLVDEFKDAGSYKVEFNASNYSSGVYFYRVESPGYIYTNKMLLSK